MTIKELHDSLYEKDRPKEPKLFMDNYEANLDLTNQVDMTNLNDYFYAMRLTCDYAILLENSGYFLKGLLYLEEAIERMENFPNYPKDQLFTIPYYELAVFHKARAFYNLNNYKDSQSTFETLHNAFQDNDKYKGWIFRIKVKRYENCLWIGLGVMLVASILKAILNGKYPFADQLCYWILLLALVTTAIFEVGKGIKLRKLKRMDIL